MDNDSAFLLYALFFRLAIVSGGVFTVFLGFLLLRQTPPHPTDSIDNLHSSERTAAVRPASAEVSIPGGVRFHLQNVTAGTLFALFGACLITAMVVQGNPETTRQTSVTQGVAVETVKVRGGQDDGIRALIQAGTDAQEKGDAGSAERLYLEALAATAPAMNGLAWIYAKNGKAIDSIALAKVAIQLDESNALYFDTLAEAEVVVGNRPDALHDWERASQLDPRFKSKLEQFRRGAQKQ